MIRRFITSLCAVMALWLIIGCQADATEERIDPNNAYAIAFDFSVLDAKTRAIGTEVGDFYDPLNENKIENMYMFLYEGETQAGYFSTLKGNLSLTTDATALSGSATAYIPKDNPTNPYQNKSYTMYVLVNYPGGENDLKGLTLTQLKQRIHTTPALIAQQTDVEKQTSFLMDGTVPTGLVKWDVAGTNVYNVTEKTTKTVELARAAAKIRLLIDQISVKDKTQDFELIGLPMVSLVNASAKTTLLSGTLAQSLPDGNVRFTTTYQEMAKKMYGTNEFYARSVPFYTYENDWSKDSDQRTYLSVKLTLRGKVDGVTKDFYYSIPVNYLVPDPSMSAVEQAGIPKVQRNHLYDIRCNIFQLGELDPGRPTELKAWISVEDWNETSPIDGSISNAHYLVVKELRPTMPNISVRDIEYVSDLPLDESVLTDFTASFTGYDYVGGAHLVSGKKNDWLTFLNGEQKQFFKNIKVTTHEVNGRKYIRVENPVPDNYVPWTIKIRAQHVVVAGETGTPLYKDIVVTQYPAVYVTGRESSGNEIYWYSPFGAYLASGLDAQGNPKSGYQTNNTLFTVHVSVPTEGMIVGDPTLNATDGKTNRGEEANKMVSPEFIIASQHGMSLSVPQYGTTGSGFWNSGSFDVSTTIGNENDMYRDYYTGYSYRYRDYWSAESRAERYWEDEYGPFTSKQIKGDRTGSLSGSLTYNKTFKYKGSWRIPTLAELELIVKIQSDNSSAVKNLLWGEAYWSAREGYAYDFQYKRAYRPTGNLPVRPVFDTYNK